MKSIFDRQRKKEFNGKTYQLTVLPAGEGYAMALRLLKLILPALGGGLDGMQHDELIHGAPRTFSDLALTICEQMDKADVLGITKRLVKDVVVDGQGIDFDEYFAANYGELITVLEWSLKENFGSFFTESGIQTRLMNLVGTLTGKAPEESTQEESKEQ